MNSTANTISSVGNYYMNPPKCTEYDYIDFLVGTQRVYSCLEAERVQPPDKQMPSHDSINRLLYRLEPGSDPLWKEVEPHVNKTRGMLVIDDSTLDKIYSKKIELVTHHWSGKHHRVVKGINLISLLWTDGDSQLPCDYRVYAKDADGLTKNDHFRAMLKQAQDRGFAPACVSFDSWYSSLENLKIIRDYGWMWLTRFKSNRLVNPDDTGNRPVSEVEIACQGTIVHLKGYGMVKIFKIVSQNGDTDYWSTNNLEIDDLGIVKYTEWNWAIENYHRGIKQYCGIERAQVRGEKAQRNHIGLAIRAFLRLERFSFRTGYSWFETKTSIIREAVRAYLKNPFCCLQQSTA